MNHRKKIVGMSLVACVSVPMLSPVLAYEENTNKEEVVYVNLNGDGSVDDIYVVNIFNPSETGKIYDYGRYKTVRNMTGTQKIHYKADEVAINASKERLYYEGQLETKEIPWKIEVRYFLNGKEYEADQVIGKSGELEIHVSIKENESQASNFFDQYALQATFLLDTNRCENLVAEGATIANVGHNKQLTYTLLPGKGAEFKITASVEDFEMEAMAINGVPLNLNIEVEDEELLNKVTQLTEAIEQLDDGASQLVEGSSDLKSGATGGLESGVSALEEGAHTLENGAAMLKDGGTSLKGGAQTMSNGATTLNEGLESLNQGILSVSEALTTLNNQSSSLTEGSSEIKSALARIQQALDQVSVTTDDLSALSNASGEIQTGIDTLVTGANTLAQSVSYESFVQAMGQNGLDIQALGQNNMEVANQVEGLVGALTAQLGTLQEAGMDTSALEAQIGQLTQVASLLRANSAAFEGTKTYFLTLNGAVSQWVEGARTLQTSYQTFDTKINELVQLLGGMAYQLTELSTAIDTLVSSYESLDSGILAYTDGVAQLLANYDQLVKAAGQLVQGSSDLATGGQTLYQGTEALLNGITSLYEGTGSLRNGAGELDEGVAKLLVGISQLNNGTHTLKAGTETLKNETSGMDQEITRQIDTLLEEITGGSEDIASFVSDKNTHVESVQFVIKGESLLKEKQEQAVVKEEKQTSFWEKLIQLFH